MPIQYNGLEYLSKKEVGEMIQKRLNKLQVENQRLKEKLKEAQVKKK